MTITKEEIERRLAALQAQFDQLQVQAHAIGGAMQDCKYWLGALEAPDETQEATP